MIAFGSVQAAAYKYRWLSGAEAMPLDKTTLSLIFEKIVKILAICLILV